MKKRYLKRYEELATSNGYSDPMVYLFGRMKALQQKGDHDGAQKIAEILLPYGHGKALPRDTDTGETAKSTVFTLD